VILGGKKDRQMQTEWLDDVEGDLRTMGIRRCRLRPIAEDRTEWAGIEREAKAL
jgi:hypothetical protein